MTKVIHWDEQRWNPNEVTIDRGTKWGNPYRIGKDGDRAEVIKKFKKYFHENKQLQEDAKRELKDKVLVCWCHPLPCHGHILAEFVNAQD